MNEPKFSGLLVINEPSFVVDDNGVGWWINPGWQSIKRATFPNSTLHQELTKKMEKTQ